MSKILDQLADQHEQRIIETLYRLEDDIIKEVTRATGGNLDIETRIAIQLQPKLRASIEENFLNEADLIINEESNTSDGDYDARPITSITALEIDSGVL